jgi:hypothetical protein
MNTHVDNNIPSVIPSNYQHLFEMGDRVEEMGKREVEDIILDVCNKDREIQFGRKVAHLNSRTLKQDEQSETSNAKAGAYLNITPVILEALSTFCSIVAAFGGAATGLFQVIAQASTSTAQYRNKITESRVEVLQHRYQQVGHIINEDSQQSQGAEREHEQDTTAIDRIMQQTQRTFELVVSGNA